MSAAQAAVPRYVGPATISRSRMARVEDPVLEDALRRDGVVVIRDAFPPEKVALFAQALPLLASRDPRLAGWDFDYPTSVTRCVAALLGDEYEDCGAPAPTEVPADGAVNEAGAWRRAMPPLFGAADAALPAVCLRAYVYLAACDVESGATEFKVGSHALATAAGLERPTRGAAAPPGSVVLYDTRILERTPHPRADVLAVAWRRTWYVDAAGRKKPDAPEMHLPIRYYYAADDADSGLAESASFQSH